MLADIELIFGMNVTYHELQINFELTYALLIFHKIIGLGLSKVFIYFETSSMNFQKQEKGASLAFLQAMHIKTDTILIS